jgi:hypothetical protein
MLKRGTSVEYSHAGGKIVQGRIKGAVAAPGFELGEWYRVSLSDERGSYSACCHKDQLRNIDNRG